MPVKDIYKISGIGTVAYGRIDYGIINQGKQIIFSPGNIISQVHSVETPRLDYVGYPGCTLGFSVPDLEYSQLQKGMVCGEINNDPPKDVVQFTAQIVVLSTDEVIRPGFEETIFCHQLKIKCKFEQFLEKIDKRNGEIIEQNPNSLKRGDAAVVVVVPERPISVETYASYPKLGKFGISKYNKLILIGIIKSVQTPKGLKKIK